MKKIMVLAALLSAIAALSFVACGTVANGGDTRAGSYPTLNDAEREIAGMSFSGNGVTYTFNADKTGITDDGSGARSIRAAEPSSGIVGDFEWSATQSGSNVAVTMTQGGKTANATFDPAASNLTVGGQTLTNLTDRIVSEMNLVRKNPALYAETYLEPRLANFSGNMYQLDKTTQVQTVEGAAAVREAISALKSTSALPALTVEKGLRAAAQDHAKYLKSSRTTGHTGQNNSTATDRMNKYGTGGTTSGNGGENINYGRTDPREIVIQLLVDDGTPGRAHRMNILNSAFSQAGSFTTTHPSMSFVSVINFNKGYKTNDAGNNATLEESLSDKAPQASGDVTPTAGAQTPTSLAGTSWLEEKSNAPSSMYMALYFTSDSQVGIGACNSKVLALDYAKSNPGGAGHHYDTRYSYSNGSGSMTLPSGASPHYGGNITVSGDILTMTNGSSTIVFRKLASASAESLAGTKWAGFVGETDGDSSAGDFEGTDWYGLIFSDGTVKLGKCYAEPNAKTYATGGNVSSAMFLGETTATYTYSNGKGTISAHSLSNNVTGSFTVDLTKKELKIGNYTFKAVE